MTDRSTYEDTQAAAATAVPVGGCLPAFSPLANRPFFYFLRDGPTGAILFMGSWIRTQTALWRRRVLPPGPVNP